MSLAALITYEKTGRWTTAFGKFDEALLAVRLQTRSLVECRQGLVDRPWSVIALECSADNLPGICTWLPRITQEFPNALAILLAEPSLKRAECVMRAAGGQQVVYTLRDLSRVCRWIRRHLRKVPVAEMTIDQWIDERLPWR
jgi:hypothetical protein